MNPFQVMVDAINKSLPSFFAAIQRELRSVGIVPHGDNLSGANTEFDLSDCEWYFVYNEKPYTLKMSKDLGYFDLWYTGMTPSLIKRKFNDPREIPEIIDIYAQAV